MPVATDLPERLKDLARRNSVEASVNRFRSDIDQLIKALEAPTSERLADTVFVEPTQLSGGLVGRRAGCGCEVGSGMFYRIPAPGASTSGAPSNQRLEPRIAFSMVG